MPIAFMLHLAFVNGINIDPVKFHQGCSGGAIEMSNGNKAFCLYPMEEMDEAQSKFF